MLLKEVAGIQSKIVIYYPTAIIINAVVHLSKAMNIVRKHYNNIYVVIGYISPQLITVLRKMIKEDEKISGILQLRKPNSSTIVFKKRIPCYIRIPGL
jgi:hypothetical protein